MTPDEYCQDKAVKSGSSFYYSFLFLPPERRRAITALYAYCREVDDVADSQGDRNVARRKLDWWAQEVGALFDGAPTHPVTRALQPFLEPYGLRRRQLVEVIDGMRMDLDGERYLDFEGLKLYCRRAAGVVGEMSAAIFGYEDPKTLQYADRLGLAFQLTNIIRDVGEDARKGRIYLPVEDMQRFGVPASVVMRSAPTPEFAALMAFQIGRARETYRQAVSLLPAADKKSQKVGLIMAAIYYALLNEIERDGAENVLTYKIAIPSPRKKRIALKTWLFGFRP